MGLLVLRRDVIGRFMFGMGIGSQSPEPVKVTRIAGERVRFAGKWEDPDLAASTRLGANPNRVAIERGVIEDRHAGCYVRDYRVPCLER
jgi:hypothetical protein